MEATDFWIWCRKNRRKCGTIIVVGSKQQGTSTAVNTKITSTDIDCMQRECKFNKERVIKLAADFNVLQ